MFDIFSFAAQNECSIAMTPLFETEEYDGYKARRLGGWHIKISKGSKRIARIVDACFPSAEERAIKEMIEELNKGGKSDV